MPVVIGAEALEEIEREGAILAGAEGELVAVEMIQADGDENILVNVERSGDPLRGHIRDVFVSVPAVVELRAKRGLPFLCLQHPMRVGRVEDESLELQLADAAQFRTHLESEVAEGVVSVSPLKKANLRIEIGP